MIIRQFSNRGSVTEMQEIADRIIVILFACPAGGEKK
jgi:hypothetical protein